MYHLSNLELSKNGAADVQISINIIEKIALGSHVISNLDSSRISFLFTLVKLLPIYSKENPMKEKKKPTYKDILTGRNIIYNSLNNQQASKLRCNNRLGRLLKNMKSI